MHVKSTEHKSFRTQMKFNTHDLVTTRNTRDQFGQETQKSKDDFHMYQTKKTSLTQRTKSPSLLPPTKVNSDERKTNSTSTRTTVNSNLLNKKKTSSLGITIPPCEINFEDLIRYTNIESQIRNDIISKFPTNSEIYLSRIGKYIEKYYYKTFIYKKKWPSNVKFKDETVRTLEDFNCLKNKEQKRKLNLQPKVFEISDEDLQPKVFKISDEDKQKEMKVFTTNKGDLPKAPPNTPRSKRIIESIGDDSNMLLNKPVTILPSQISYEDFRNFTNIESCVHEDILRKDPKHAELHFSRVECYIKKYYDNFFILSKNWPSRIKFLDKTIGSLGDLKRKKHRMRYRGPMQLKVPIIECKDEKNQSTHLSLVIPNTSDQTNNPSDQINKENRKKSIPNIGQTLSSTNVQKITSNAGIDNTRVNANNANLSNELPVCNRSKYCMKSSKNLNLPFCDVPKYGKFSPSKDNCSMHVESETNAIETNGINGSRKRKATILHRSTVKKQCTNLKDSLQEETMCQPDVKRSCNSKNSTDSQFQNTETSISTADGATISQDNVSEDLQFIKKEPNDNLTNEELDVLRSLCIKLESETNQESETTDLIVSQYEQENLIKSCLKKLSRIDSNSKEMQETRVVPFEQSQPAIKTEFNGKFSQSDISSYSPDVNIVENNITESIVIADTGNTVDDLLEQMMNISETSEYVVPYKRIVKSSGNARINVNSSKYNNNNVEKNTHDLNMDEFFDELAELLDDVEDDFNSNQANHNNVSSPCLLPLDHMKSKKVSQNENDAIIQKSNSEDFVDKRCRKISSNLEISPYSEKNLSNSSTPMSSLSTDYVSETTICSDSSLIVPYQSTPSANFSDKPVKPKRKTSEVSRTRKIGRTKSMRSGKLRKSISNQRKSIVNTISQPPPSKKRKVNLICVKLKKGLIPPEQDNMLRVTTTSEDRTQDELSQFARDCEREDESGPSNQLKRIITCHSCQWISWFHWHRVPNTIMLTTHYESSIPLLNIVGVTPVKPMFSLWRHQLLSIKIFSDKVNFRMDIDASNEDAMYSMLETSLHGAVACSSMNLVVLRYLQTIFDYFPPICLEKQNIYITDTAPSTD